MLNTDRYHKIEVAGWDDYVSRIQDLQASDPENDRRWIFRGVSKSDYPMATLIEREANRSGIPLSDLVEKEIEIRIINDFRRRAHHHMNQLPERHDLADWLALMQHYGAPTRLLDWSYSPLIAVYFAMESAGEPNEESAKDRPCAVWAMESEEYTTRHTLEEIGQQKIDEFFEEKIVPDLAQLPETTKRNQFGLIQYLFKFPTPGVFLVNPFRLSARSSIQQGVHLMPGDITKSFENNLFAHDITRDNLTKFEIEVTPANRKDFIKNLHRMNITRASLFPGLQGFAESMRTRMSLPEFLSY